MVENAQQQLEELYSFGPDKEKKDLPKFVKEFDVKNIDFDLKEVQNQWWSTGVDCVTPGISHCSLRSQHQVNSLE